MKADFPGMNMWLSYPAKVEPPIVHTEDIARAWKEHANDYGIIMAKIKEKINLHEIAKGYLMSIGGCKTWDELASSSEYSMKAIHIVALGLKGLINHGLNRNVSEAEKAACLQTTTGNINAATRKSSRDLMTLLLGGCTPPNRKGGKIKGGRLVKRSEETGPDDTSECWRTRRLEARKVSWEDYYWESDNGVITINNVDNEKEIEKDNPVENEPAENLPKHHEIPANEYDDYL